MTQTTGAMARSGFKVEVSVDASTWVDISGAAAGVKNDGGDALVGDQMTAGDKYAIVTAGNKIEPRELTFSCLYTEVASTEPWEIVRARYEGANQTIAVRWSPSGGAVGKFRYSTSVTGSAAAVVPIASLTLPESDASSGDPALFEFSVKTPALYKETIGT